MSANVRWVDEGRTAIVEMRVSREMYDRLMAGWVPEGWVMLQEANGEVQLVIHTGPAAPMERGPAG